MSDAEFIRIRTEFGPAGEPLNAHELEGLCKNRPSVMPGDRILVYLCPTRVQSAEEAYKGHVGGEQQVIEVIISRQFESFGEFA